MTSTQVVTGLGWPLIPGKDTTPVGWMGPVSRETPAPPPASDTPVAGTEAPADERNADPGEVPSPDTDVSDRAVEAGDASSISRHSLAAAAGRRFNGEFLRPDGTRVLVVANQKGGVGKTTTTVNLAAALAQQGLRVLVVDLDPQGNASTALSIAHAEGTPNSYDVLVGNATMAEVVAECAAVPGLFAIPATIDLAGAEIELVPMVARENRLRNALTSYLESVEKEDGRFDYVFIDCPPSLGLLTVNALTAGEELLIPIQCEYYALEGLSHLLQTIEQVRLHLNPRLRIGAIVLTMFDARTRLAAGVAEEVRRHFGSQVLRTAVPRSVRISEAPGYGQTVLTYDPASVGALSYLEVAAELTASPLEAAS